MTREVLLEAPALAAGPGVEWGASEISSMQAWQQVPEQVTGLLRTARMCQLASLRPAIWVLASSTEGPLLPSAASRKSLMFAGRNGGFSNATERGQPANGPSFLTSGFFVQLGLVNAASRSVSP